MSKVTKMGTSITYVLIGVVILVISSLVAVKVGHDLKRPTDNL